MTRSQLIRGLLVTALTLALGTWSSIVVADRYQRSHQLAGPMDATGPVVPPNPETSSEGRILGGESFKWRYFKRDWPSLD